MPRARRLDKSKRDANDSHKTPGQKLLTASRQRNLNRSFQPPGIQAKDGSRRKSQATGWVILVPVRRSTVESLYFTQRHEKNEEREIKSIFELRRDWNRRAKGAPT
jgi:hypothetical protein